MKRWKMWRVLTETEEECIHSHLINREEYTSNAVYANCNNDHRNKIEIQFWNLKLHSKKQIVNRCILLNDALDHCPYLFIKWISESVSEDVK
jgi:hypothetical protein